MRTSTHLRFVDDEVARPFDFCDVINRNILFRNHSALHQIRNVVLIEIGIRYVESGFETMRTLHNGTHFCVVGIQIAVEENIFPCTF